MGEFELIERYFRRPTRRAALGIGDDCALLQPRPGRQIAVSSDMLVQGRHFFADVAPDTLGHKALAVNLSDLAACGAHPVAFTLALALPHVQASWLEAFSHGMFALADAHGCELIGGDTTRGPLTICITVFGEVPVAGGHSQALLRSGARAGDDIYVSGTLGDARMALLTLLGKLTLPAPVLAQTRRRLESPSPRVALGLALRGIASSAIDISDGLVGDLGHVLAASQVGATIDTAVAGTLLECHAAESVATLPAELRLACVLAGGDDYELAFTAAPGARSAVHNAATMSTTRITRVGQIQAEPGLYLVDAQGVTRPNTYRSFDHFEDGHDQR